MKTSQRSERSLKCRALGTPGHEQPKTVNIFNATFKGCDLPSTLYHFVNEFNYHHIINTSFQFSSVFRFLIFFSKDCFVHVATELSLGHVH